MKKVLAMVVAVAAMAGAGVAQRAKSGAVTAKPALTSTGANAGYVPLFTDTAIYLIDWMIFETTSTGDNGIGTATPATTLKVSGTNPKLRVDNYSNNVGD